MNEKTMMQEARDIQLAIELISLGARLQILESETQLSRGRLLKLYKELRGSPPPKGLLPFSADWFMIWEQNIHASLFYNIYLFFCQEKYYSGGQAVVNAYRLYLEQCPYTLGEPPILSLTRAWILIRFVNSNMLEHARCNTCDGRFINHSYQPVNLFTCSLCRPPSRAIKKRKLFANSDDIVTAC